MYQVLLVDDEPIILSGIKFLIDWEKHGCQIAGSARNGQQALEKIRTLRPDIVICDISMPVLSGIELLELVSAESPEIVFIMLTNHPDFQLARDSLRFRALDYLLKSQLDAESLEASLARACAERDSRTRLARVEMADEYFESSQRRLLDNAFLRVVQTQPGVPLGKTTAVLRENGVLDGYAVAYIPLDFSQTASIDDSDELRRLFGWVRDVTEKLAGNLFAHTSLFSPDEHNSSLFLLCWGLTEQEWKEKFSRLSDKLSSASVTVTQVRACALATGWFSGEEQLDRCRTELFRLRDVYYLEGHAGVFLDDIPEVEYNTLGLASFGDRLAAELRSHNAAGCRSLFDRAITRVRETPHQKSQALWLCGEICGAVGGLYKEFLPAPESGKRLPDSYDPAVLNRLGTRDQLVLWLELIRNELCALLEQSSSGKSDFAEKARQYVLDNVDKRIMLQDVADAVCISPAYLSALFKKVYGQNLVDFINKAKSERACELICEGKYLIYEISYMLGFENAYYFTKVFKRHIGLTPTAYQKKIRGGEDNHVE